MWRLFSISSSASAAIPALFLVFCLAGAPSPSRAADAVVTDLRVGDHITMTRIVLDFTNPVTFSYFILPDPYRVVIDLPEVGWRLPQRPLPENIGSVQRLRYGLFKSGMSRVVLDMAGPVVVDNAFWLAPGGGRGHRLVLDLVPASRDNMLEEARRLAPQASAAAATSTFRPPPRKPEGRSRKRVIALDPGHGGVDPGTVGVSGSYEKNITLAMARAFKEQLEASGRYRVVLTRQRDIFVSLRDRVAIAREGGAELFISIHADAIRNRGIRGLSVYTLSEKASDKEAAELAEKENKADLIAGIDLTNENPDVANILIELAQRESMNQSARLAAGLVEELGRETRLLRKTHRFAGFAVLKALDMPSVLLEVGFLSNPEDEKALKRKSHGTKLALAVLRAINGYYERIEEANVK